MGKSIASGQIKLEFAAAVFFVPEKANQLPYWSSEIVVPWHLRRVITF